VKFDFGGEVTRRGGEFKPFSHKAFMDQKPDLLTRGHCFGLTVVWLGRYVRDQSKGAAELLGNLTFTQASQDPQAIMVIRQIQNMVNSRSMTNRMNTGAKAKVRKKHAEIMAVFGDADDALLNDLMRSLGVSGVTFYGDDLPDLDVTQAALRYLRQFESGLYVIYLPKHVVGAIVDPKRQVYKFLDVNFGQGVWKFRGKAAVDADHFHGFVESYLTAPGIRQGYADGKLVGTMGFANALLPG
jgi:hypothetical protein